MGFGRLVKEEIKIVFIGRKYIWLKSNNNGT